MFSRCKKSLSLRAVTLAELIVTVALVVIVTGLVLGIFIQTRSSAIAGQERVAMETHARTVADEVRGLLEMAVPPSSLDIAKPEAGLRFAPESCSVISARNFSGKDFYLTTIRNSRDAKSKQGKVEIMKSLLDPAATVEKTEGQQFLGSASDEYSTTISFEYGARVGLEEAQGFKAFQTSLGAGEYPRVIRLKVHVEPLGSSPGKEKPKAFDLTTAVRVL